VRALPPAALGLGAAAILGAWALVRRA